MIFCLGMLSGAFVATSHQALANYVVGFGLMLAGCLWELWAGY